MSDTDVSFAMEAKSDQLNALDIAGIERIICINKVTVKKGADQPISVFFDGDNNRPWKPSKGMVRILAGAWGTDSAKWVGKSATIFCEPSVTWGGKQVGGIWIKALSDIKSSGISATVAINRTKRVIIQINCLVVEAKEYPVDTFNKALSTMGNRMKSGSMTLQAIIAKCQETGTLSTEQLAQLEALAPLDVDEQQPTEPTTEKEEY